MDPQALSQAFTAMQQAMDMMERGEFNGADTQLERAERLAPWLPSINFMRGQVLVKAGRIMDAARQNAVAAGKAQNLSFQSHASLSAALEQTSMDAAYQSYSDLLAPRHAPDQLKERAQAYINAFNERFAAHGETVLETARGWIELHVPLLRERGFDFRGARVLEIGGSILPAVCMLYASLGAKVSTVDKFRTPEAHSVLSPLAQYFSHQAIFRKLNRGDVLPAEWVQDVPPLIMDEVLEFDGKAVRFDPLRLDYRGGVDAADMPFEDASFDLISSAATLEHVGDPEGDPADTIREIVRLLKPGGWSAHLIDLQDHRDPENAPIEFLKYSDHEWRTMQVPQNQRANRWRAGRWRRAFQDAGIEEVHVIENSGSEPYVLPDGLFESLHEDFKSLSPKELSVIDVFILSRKPE